MRIFWIVMVAAVLSLGRLARAADENPPQTNILSAAANTDVILAAVLGNEEDPFALEPALNSARMGESAGQQRRGAHFSSISHMPTNTSTAASITMPSRPTAIP